MPKNTTRPSGRAMLMLKTAASVLFVAGGCFGIWLLTLSSVSDEEILVGSLCALVTGGAAVATKRATRVHWSVRAIPLRPLVLVPLAVAGDALQVLLRPIPGVGRPTKVVTRELRQRGNKPEATTRRVVTTLAVTSAPGAMVLDLDAESGRLTVHSLQTAGPHPEEAFDQR